MSYAKHLPSRSVRNDAALVWNSQSMCRIVDASSQLDFKWPWWYKPLLTIQEIRHKIERLLLIRMPLSKKTANPSKLEVYKCKQFPWGVVNNWFSENGRHGLTTSITIGYDVKLLHPSSCTGSDGLKGSFCHSLHTELTIKYRKLRGTQHKIKRL